MADNAIVWFRQDLRLTDTPALHHAFSSGYSIIPVFILDDANAGQWRHGGASRWWLHQSLLSLNADLSGRMIFLSGDAHKLLPELATQTNARAVFWNRCYEPWRIERDSKIKQALKSSGLEVGTFNASLLWEPWDVLKDDGTPYKVFTPFYRKGCLGKEPPAPPLPAPAEIRLAKTGLNTPLDELRLIPSLHWYEGMARTWAPGESSARQRLSDFLRGGLRNYAEKRNRPDMENVSRLSPHLHFGEISPRTVWHEAQAAGIAQGLEADLDVFCSELGWREFSYSLLYHNPGMTWDNLNKRFDRFEWFDHDSAELLRWQKGQTGIPIVDAGMRQLWQTGWMHNRVRMIVASLLVKNMLVHWRQGAQWFWDTLVDADLASNSASWQWVAGSGADAAPYFRIFNPVEQGKKFDPNGEYVRRYVPEIAHLDTRFIHAPWESPVPPANYPPPIVDLKKSRQKALEAFEKIKASS